jgi:hypothetical protein
VVIGGKKWNIASTDKTGSYEHHDLAANYMHGLTEAGNNGLNIL